MDTITHGIVGALAGKALFARRDLSAGAAGNDNGRTLSSPTARAAIVACTLGAMFPDIDIFAGPLAHNPLAIMEWHRNLTHSAVLLPFWALVLAAISLPLARWVKWETPPFLTLFVVYAVAIATHIFLDLITSFGTMVWSPLRYSRPAWDWVFILDLTLTALALTPQLVAWCYRAPRRFLPRAVGVWALLTAGAFGAYLFATSQGYGFPVAVAGVVSAIFAAVIFLPAAQGTGFRWTRASWCRAGLGLVCLYIGLAAFTHHKAFADVQHFAESRQLQVDELAALPLPPTLTHWVGLISAPEGVWRITFHEPAGSVESAQFYRDGASRDLIAEARKLHDVQIYLWFARFPIWSVTPRPGDETEVDISDVRFFRGGDPVPVDEPQKPTGFAGRPSRRSGFTFEIVFDARGQILSHGFKEEP